MAFTTTAKALGETVDSPLPEVPRCEDWLMRERPFQPFHESRVRSKFLWRKIRFRVANALIAALHRRAP
jgi:hypothetical protein